MSEDTVLKNKDTAKSSNKIVAALHRGIATPVLSHATPDPYNDLAARLEEKLTIDGKIRLLLTELQSDSMVRKGRAVTQFNPILLDYSIPANTITEIWAIAKVCLSSADPAVRQETLILMARCIELQRDDLHSWQRVTYYDLIQKHGVNVQELPYLEHALYKLIEEGKNVAEVSGTLLDLLARWIGFCSTHAHGKTFDESDSGKQYRIAFHISERVFQYNFSRFEEQDVTTFIEFLCTQIGTSTAMLDVISKILDIIEVIPRYGGVVPIAAVPHIVAFICSYASSRLTQQFAERFWQIMLSLLRLDHIAHRSLTILESVPAQPPAPGVGRDFSPRHWQKFRIRGALIFLGNYLKAQREYDDLEATLSISRALISIQNAINHSDLSIAHCAIDFLEEIISHPDEIRRLTYEDWEIVWDTLSVLVREFNELFRAAEISPSDSNSSFTSEETGGDDRLIQSLLKQLEKMIFVFQDFCVTDEYTGSLFRCVMFQMTLSKLIPDPCDNFILSHYENFHLCMPTNSTWLTECEVILEDFVRDDMKIREIRLRAISLLARVIPLVTVDDDRSNDDFFKRIVLPILKILRKERDPEVCEELISLAIEIAESEKESWALEVCKILSSCAAETPQQVQQRTTDDKNKLVSWRDSVTTISTISMDTITEESPDISFEAVKGMVDIFERSLMKDSPNVSQKLFSELVRLVQQGPLVDSKVRIEALDVLLRLRADSLYSVYLAEPLLRRNGRIPVAGMLFLR